MNTFETIFLVFAIVLANFICYAMGRIDGYRHIGKIMDEAIDKAFDEFLAEHPELKKE